MTPLPIIHVLEDIHPKAMVRLRESATVLTPDIAFPSKCDALIVRARKITSDHMDACPNLKVIGKHGAGLDAIDLDAAKERGISVYSTPGANAQSVADLAIGFALSLLRQLNTVSLVTKSGATLTSEQKQGWDLNELKVGIFGLGAIGRATAHRLIGGFGSQVQAFDPGISNQDWPDDIERCENLPHLLKTSQILFLHAPLLPSTRNAINASTIASMPKGVFIINCARGGIVDESALVQALENGHIAGAACDVFEIEPPTANNPLFKFNNFLATPHIGGATNGALFRVGLSIVEQVLGHIQHTKTAAEKSL